MALLAAAWGSTFTPYEAFVTAIAPAPLARVISPLFVLLPEPELTLPPKTLLKLALWLSALAVSLAAGFSSRPQPVSSSTVTTPHANNSSSPLIWTPVRLAGVTEGPLRSTPSRLAPQAREPLGLL